MQYPSWGFSEAPFQKITMSTRNPLYQYLIDEERQGLTFKDIKVNVSFRTTVVQHATDSLTRSSTCSTDAVICVQDRLRAKMVDTVSRTVERAQRTIVRAYAHRAIKVSNSEGERRDMQRKQKFIQKKSCITLHSDLI